LLVALFPLGIPFRQVNPLGEAALFDGLVQLIEPELINVAVVCDDSAKLETRVIRKRRGENRMLDGDTALAQELAQPRPHTASYGGHPSRES
jgi:hypothetical protein